MAQSTERVVRFPYWLRATGLPRGLPVERVTNAQNGKPLTSRFDRETNLCEALSKGCYLDRGQGAVARFAPDDVHPGVRDDHPVHCPWNHQVDTLDGRELRGGSPVRNGRSVRSGEHRGPVGTSNGVEVPSEGDRRGAVNRDRESSPRDERRQLSRRAVESRPFDLREIDIARTARVKSATTHDQERILVDADSGRNPTWGIQRGGRHCEGFERPIRSHDGDLSRADVPRSAESSGHEHAIAETNDRRVSAGYVQTHRRARERTQASIGVDGRAHDRVGRVRAASVSHNSPPSR